MAREGLMDDTGYDFDLCDWNCGDCKYGYLCEEESEEEKLNEDKRNSMYSL